MPVSKEQAQLIAPLIRARRPHGAFRWDEPGIVAAIERVKHLGLGEVMDALGRAADDRDARTPAVITNLRSSYWRPDLERVGRVKDPFDPEETCSRCNQPTHPDSDDHPFVSIATQAAAAAAVSDEARKAAARARVQALKQEIPTEERPEPEPRYSRGAPKTENAAAAAAREALSQQQEEA